MFGGGDKWKLAGLAATLASATGVPCMAASALAQVANCAPVATIDSLFEDIDARLETTLEGGARVRLFGVETPDAEVGARAATEARAWMTDRNVRVEFFARQVDRWGRRPARLSALDSEGANPFSLGETLIAAGLARARPEAGAISCMAPLYVAEARARQARTGIWGSPTSLPIAALRREEFVGRDGQTVLVEGRVASTGETATRLYLNFGPIRTVDFSATISRAALKAFMTAGVDPRSLTGQFVRVRGLLDLRFGPQVEIVQPSALEMIASPGFSPYNGQVGRP